MNSVFATRVCAVSLALLLLVKVLWMSVVAPTNGIAASLANALLPLLPFVAAWAFKLRGLWIYGGIGAWLCFCHGAMEWVVSPDQRLWALLEVLLAVAYFVGLWARTRRV